MKKIVYLVSTLHRTGPTNVLAGIIKNLDKTKFYPIVITLSPEPNLTDSWRSELEQQKVEVYSLNLSRIKGLFFAGIKLKNLIDKIQPDVVHCHCFRSAVLAVWVLNQYNKIATIHCDYEEDFKMAYGSIKGEIMSFFYSKSLKQMRVRIACSKMLADLLNKKYPYMHFDFVNNGVDTEKFCPAKDKTILRQKLGLPIDKKIVIWAGSFIPRKDPLTMVQAIKKIPQGKYYFVFCGARGPLLDVCKEELKNRKDVLFTGYITNIKEYFQASDIYISTSLSEGLPLAVLEACFCGLVPLLSDIPQHKYILPQQIICHCLYNGEKELLEKLTYLLTEDTTSLLSIIAKNINYFSAKNMAISYMEAYNKLL